MKNIGKKVLLTISLTFACAAFKISSTKDVNAASSVKTDDMNREISNFLQKHRDYSIVGSPVEVKKDSETIEMCQMFRTKNSRSRKFDISRYYAKSYDLGNTVSLGSSYTNSKSKIRGSVFNASLGIEIEDNFLGMNEVGFEFSLQAIYGKDITYNETSSQSRGISYSFEITQTGTYSLCQNVVGYDYVVMTFVLEPNYVSKAETDKKGRVTGYVNVQDGYKWSKYGEESFSTNVDEYFSIEFSRC